MGQAELAAYVQSHLREKGIDVILSGGAAVALYTSGRYVSRDLDFVNRYFARRPAITQAMEDIGFKESERHFEHPDSAYIVEFPPGPLAVGDQPITEIEEVPFETGTLRLISPTDCVKDRLAWYYHSGDRQCLLQAVLVSKAHTIDLADVRRWPVAEGKLPEYEAFLEEIRDKR